MRDIKFRAWDTETKEMSYDFLNRNWLKVCIESPYVELMQYTGLTDRNVKEIYEGDIARNENGEIGVIEFHKSWASFYYSLRFGRNEYKELVRMNESRAMWNEWNRLEVIGNIHEHPHLLTKEGTK